MNKRLTASFLLTVLTLVSCQDKEAGQTHEAESATSSVLLSPEEKAAIQEKLSEQKIGKGLVGTTARLQDGKLVDAPLTHAPEYYLLYFSASW